MIKKTALAPRLAEVGKIKIGGKGETRKVKGKPGQTYQLPIRYGCFVVTTTERDKATGNFRPDEKIMKAIGSKPRELRIRLYFDDIEMNLQTEFAMYIGKKRACSGDGESCTRLVKKGRELTDEKQTLPCPGTNCEIFKDNKCKASARLFCAVADSMEIGGVHVFRTHSINSVMAMTGALEFFKNNTNGILQGLPLKLKMVKKTTEEHGDIDYVTIVLDGIEMLEMRKSAALELQNREMLGVDMKAYQSEIKSSGVLIDYDDPADVESEFYNQDGEPEPEKKEVTGTTADDVAKKLDKKKQPPHDAETSTDTDGKGKSEDPCPQEQDRF